MKRRAIVIFLIVVGALMAGYGTAYVASEDVRYITRAGFEQTQILQARRPISKILADPKTDATTRGSLQLVLAARDFAASLDFEAKDTYTTYADIGRDTLLVVLSASPKNCLCPYTWKYPIVGRIPYKGFFDPAMAQKETSKLEARGYDTYLRPAAAFSTLGWFNDPLLSTAMTRDSVELAALVLHEIAHNTLYVKSATPFNESFAQLAGYRGAEAFFRSRGEPAAADRAAARWEDEVVLSGYYTALAARLDSLYQSAPDSAALADGRAQYCRLGPGAVAGTRRPTTPFLPNRSDLRASHQQRADHRGPNLPHQARALRPLVSEGGKGHPSGGEGSQDPARWGDRRFGVCGPRTRGER